MTHTILEATANLFKYGYYLEDGTFIGTILTGKDFTYDAVSPMAPITGKIALFTETIFDKTSSPEIETVKIAKLPFADELSALVPDYYDFNSLSAHLHTFENAKMLMTGGDDFYDSSSWNTSGVDLRGMGGNDTIYGGSGDDTIKGGTGNDTLFGADGADELFGNAGNDMIYGDKGEDILVGGGGNDMIWGGADADNISGGSGDDMIYGGKGDNRLSGDKGNDFVTGDRGNDWMAGGRGTDELYGGGGTDRMAGGNGSDTFVFKDRALDEGYTNIVDFDLDQDVLRIETTTDMTAAQSYASFMANAVDYKGSVVWTSTENDISVRLARVDLADLTEDHFADAFAFA
ncbi:calcium-binding protein [Algirhabdus cladophorae]|uniref:calcium-binding protein n=1 Tax=Algirhabdus cladophorae TaxID=3377108 RepID=UPI003B84811C